MIHSELRCTNAVALASVSLILPPVWKKRRSALTLVPGHSSRRWKLAAAAFSAWPLATNTERSWKNSGGSSSSSSFCAAQ